MLHTRLGVVTCLFLAAIFVATIVSADSSLAPEDYTQQAKLATGTVSDGYGSRVAISGDTAVVYSRLGFYVYVRSGTTWTQQALLVPSDAMGGVFGVSFSADTVVIGGALATVNSNANQGAAYVFVRTGTSWTQQARLTASDGSAGDQFGQSVAISGDSIIVGAWRDDIGANTDQGSAYVFVRQGTSWTEQAKLTADNGIANDWFGERVTIDGDTAVVGRDLFPPGSEVYVFTRVAGTWTQQARLSACESSMGTRCYFGYSIGIKGDTLVVGDALLSVGNTSAQGGVYVFVRAGGTWTRQQKLLASDAQPDDGFGASVDIQGDVLIVGAHAGNVRLGSAYVFTRAGSVWTQQQKLQEASPNVSNLFGLSVSISGSTFIVGTPWDQGTPGPNAIGAAYVYTQPAVAVIRSPFDFDGDGKTDISIFRPGPGEWWYQRSSDLQVPALQFGASTDKITPGDFTGDGKADFAFWRPSTGFWFILRSEDNSFFSFPFGATGDVPVPADYDADGKTDAAVFRPSTNNWFILNSGGSGTTIATFGAAGDVPVTADYDGDGKSDIAIYRPGPREWWIQRSTAGLIAFQFGATGDRTVSGDYTGDGKADVAFWRPSNGFWFILRSEDSSFFSFPFGANDDIPAPGDYDGDGKFDATVFRPTTSTWYVNRSTAGVLIQQFGQSGDLPVPNAFVR